MQAQKATFASFAPRAAEAPVPAGEDRPTLSEASMRAVLEGNQARILRLALGMLRDRDLAEDVLQETFVRAFRFYKSFRSEAAISTWLYRIALNLCIDAQRKSQRMGDRFDGAEESVDWADPAATPESIVELGELARLADSALETLSPNHRAILLLREVEGLSYEKIARVLRIPTGTVMSRLFHARANLQRECARLSR
jgi:RNA polymerase sigma-70 factor, ECF subfamily